MHRKICLAALCMMFVALCYAMAAPAPTKGTGRLAIVPAQCPIVLQLHGVERVRDRIKATLSAANPNWGDIAVREFDSYLQNIPEGRKLQGLAPNGPHYLAYLDMPNDESSIQALAFIARVNNFTAFRDGLMTEDERKKLVTEASGIQMAEIKDQPVYFLEKPDFAIVTPSKEVAEKMAKSYDGLDSKMPANIAESFTSRDISLYVAMSDVNKQHGDSIRQIRDLALMAMQGGVGGMDENSAEVARKIYGGMFQLVLDSEILVITTDFRPEGIAFQTQMRVGPESIANSVLKLQQAGSADALAKLPAGQMMYFGASGLSPETMKAFMAMNAGITKAPEGAGKALEELAAAKSRSMFGAMSYPLAGVTIQEFDDAPRAMKATIAMLEAVGEGGSFGGGFVKGKPEVKAAAQTHHGISWTSYHMQWDFDKIAEMMPAGGDEMKSYMKKLMGDGLHGWIGVSGNRMIQVMANDWATAQKLIDGALTAQDSVGAVAAFQTTRKEMPQTASLVYLIDAGPFAFLMSDSLLPLFKGIGVQVPLPDKLTPVKFAPAFVGMAITLQPEQASFDLFVPVSAVTEVSKLVMQFLMGAN